MFIPEITVKDIRTGICRDFVDYGECSRYLVGIGCPAIRKSDMRPGFYIYGKAAMISLDIPNMLGLGSDYDPGSDILRYSKIEDGSTLIAMNLGEASKERFYLMKKCKAGCKTNRLRDYRIRDGEMHPNIKNRVIYIMDRYWSYDQILAMF